VNFTTKYTDDQICDAIALAIKEGDLSAAASLIRLLAVQAPQKAQDILDAVTNRELVIRIPMDDIR
jgi:hypothetical protein